MTFSKIEKKVEGVEKKVEGVERLRKVERVEKS